MFLHRKQKVQILELYIYNCTPDLLSLHSKITEEKIEEFKQELSVFAESFNMHGPGAVGDDLDKGTHDPSFCYYTVFKTIISNDKYELLLEELVTSFWQDSPSWAHMSQTWLR